MENKQLKTLIPFDIQFFAEDPGQDGGTSQDNGVDPGQDGGDGGTEPTVEQVLSELASERAEKERFKASIDKLTHKNAELTKQLRQRMTSQEQEDEAKREQREAEIAELQRLQLFEKRTLAEKRYLLQGMSAETAEKAAEAEVNGDMDELSKIQKQHLEAVVKAEEAKWLGSRPAINAGDGNAYSSMTKEEIMAIKDSSERQKAIAMNMDLF